MWLRMYEYQQALVKQESVDAQEPRDGKLE